MTQRIPLAEARKLLRAQRKPRVEREHAEQVALVTWAKFESGRVPELALLFAIPNAGKRSKGAGGKLRAEGMKAGVPDLCLPVPSGKFHGLFIELKAKGGRPTGEQVEWLRALTAQGYYASICVGWEDAKRTIENYLRYGPPLGEGVK